MRLSALRPLPWGWCAPIAAAGIVLGEILERFVPDASGRWLLAACLVWPAVRLRSRALGAGVAIGLVAAAVGAARGRDLRHATEGRGLPAGPVDVDGVVVAIAPRPPRGARVDLRIEGAGGAIGGGLVRLYLGQLTADAWAVGARARLRVPLAAPRGLCNLGVDDGARSSVRAGVVAVARLKGDRQIVLEPGITPAARLAAALERARHGIRTAIERRLAPPESAVMEALLLGEQREIPEDLRAAYRVTGTAHVLSVSGLHIAIVAACALRIARAVLARCRPIAERFPAQRLAPFAALAAVSGYAMLVGPSVATTRSLVMGSVLLGGLALARRASIAAAIGWAGIAVAVADPAAWSDASCQLSFGAVVAIAVGMRAVEARWPALLGIGKRGARGARLLVVAIEGALVSACASLGTAAFTAYHFGSVSAVGVVANLVVVPLVGWLALLAGLAGVAASAIVLPIGDGCLALAGLCVTWADGIVLAAAQLPGAAIGVPRPSPLQVAALSGGLLAAGLSSGRRRVACLAGAGILSLVPAASAALALAFESPFVRVAFLDVGQGDGAVLELAPRRAIVVDGGGLWGGFDTGARVVAPVLFARGVRRVDAIAMSHPERDHIGGLPTLVRELEVGEFWSTGARSASGTFAALEGALGERGVARRDLLPGRVGLPLPSDAEVEVLHPPPGGLPPSPNDRSMVLAIRYGATRIVFAGDVEAAAERLVVAAREASATILKVPHHGSRTSSTPRWVDAIRPGLAVASVGASNRFGFPASEVRQRYGARGAAWLETARAGEVDIESDGQLERVSTCRQP